MVHEQPVDRRQDHRGHQEVLHPAAVRVPRSDERSDKSGSHDHSGISETQETTRVSLFVFIYLFS